MENLGFGQILLLIVFILLPLGNFVMRESGGALKIRYRRRKSPDAGSPPHPSSPGASANPSCVAEPSP